MRGRNSRNRNKRLLSETIAFSRPSKFLSRILLTINRVGDDMIKRD